MTDDISDYSFDFEKEVSDLRRSLGSLSKYMIFAEVDVILPRGYNSPPKIESRLIGDGFSERMNSSTARNIVDSIYSANPDASSGTYILLDGSSRLIHIRENESFTNTFGEENKSFMRLFTLYHETGHALIPGHAVDNNHPFCECAADAYAALRFFQRFGPEANNIVSMISWKRSLRAIDGDTSHLTTTVLDKIAADSARHDFSKLSPAETIKLAETYAKEWTPKVKMLSATRRLFKQGESFGYTRLIQTCLASHSDFSFYIGAKLFQPFMQPQGVVLNDQPRKIKRKARQEIATAIEERAANMILHNIFNRAAVRSADEPSLTELLKVSRPKGQKQFTVKI